MGVESHPKPAQALPWGDTCEEGGHPFSELL